MIIDVDFFCDAWYAAQPLASHRPRDRDRRKFQHIGDNAAESQLARSFDRCTRHGLRLIQGGKDPVDLPRSAARRSRRLRLTQLQPT
jgi:hypothetical protein